MNLDAKVDRGTTRGTPSGAGSGHMPQESETSRLLVGRYRLGPVLGKGAHGTVYLAEDLGRGGRHVALKLGTDPNEAPDFDDEATKALFWFRHPNWAEILDMGMVDDHQWFQTTRYVNGKSLDLLEGPQDPELVWQFLEDGARVLRALHRLGLIHYDVTPANFLLEQTPSGPRFVLTDGGLAHLGPVSEEARGTPLYMAPDSLRPLPTMPESISTRSGWLPSVW